MPGKVFIVHAIDTEGPLQEPIEATFERVKEIFGIELEATQTNLAALQAGAIDLGDKTSIVQETVSGHRISTLGSWDKIARMLSKVSSPSFRNKLPDSSGNGWKFNWFCLDHIDYDYNPRNRDIGYHKVHDYYTKLVNTDPNFTQDCIQWHFHPMSTYNDAHRCATHYLRTDHFYQILSRRIIDRKFFPSCFRAGFQAERPDSHWLLEQFIPFDITNMATKDTSDIDNSIDFKLGRSGNWRKSPSDWSVYHPSHDEYQVPGNCRRLIGRALNLRNRIGNLTLEELEVAFKGAQEGRNTLVGLCSHDWRDLEAEIDYVYELIDNVKERYPEVEFLYSNANDAFRHFVRPENKDIPPIELSIELIPKSSDDVPYIKVECVQGKTFGPQPFLAIKTKSRRYIHDNFDFDLEDGRWFYAFHDDTLPLEDVETIGVASNDFNGNTSVKILDLES